MTEKQKSEIARLRSKGMSYSRIGKNLGISKNTVNAYCRRRGLKADTQAVSDDTMHCRECVKTLVQKAGREPRLFCSKKCREKCWSPLKGSLSRRTEDSYQDCP